MRKKKSVQTFQQEYWKTLTFWIKW